MPQMAPWRWGLWFCGFIPEWRLSHHTHISQILSSEDPIKQPAVPHTVTQPASRHTEDLWGGFGTHQNKCLDFQPPPCRIAVIPKGISSYYSPSNSHTHTHTVQFLFSFRTWRRIPCGHSRVKQPGSRMYARAVNWRIMNSNTLWHCWLCHLWSPSVFVSKTVCSLLVKKKKQFIRSPAAPVWWNTHIIIRSF